MAEVRWHGKRFLASAETELEKAIAIGAIRVQREARRITRLHSGPTKTLPDAVPSQPGQPPHLRTGTLNRSIDQETFRKAGTFVGRIGTNLKYGRYLEMGTTKMGARPYLRPSLTAMRRRILGDITKAGGRFRGG